nr:hypothetical protein [Haloarcula sp. CBA1115]
MIEQLPVLLVVLPIIGGAVPLVASLVSDRAGWPVATLTLVGQAGLAGLLAWTVSTSGTVSYAVGGFAAPYGIELVVDGLSGPSPCSWPSCHWACSRTPDRPARTRTPSTACTCCWSPA